MSEFCEVCESVAQFTSSTPATDVIMVVINGAQFSSSLVLGYSPVLTSTAAFTSSLPFAAAYTTLVSTFQASSTALVSTVVAASLTSTAEFESSVVQGLNNLAVSSAVFSSTVTSDVPVLLVSMATFTSTVAPSNEANLLLADDAAVFKSNVVMGLYEFRTSSAAFSSTVTPLRTASVSLDSTAQFTSTAFPSITVDMVMLESAAEFTSSVTSQIEATTILISDAVFTSEAWYTDALAKAWLMNTETAAMSWYENFAFESIVSHQGVEYAVGPDGIYRLDGATDAGRPIAAKLQSGLADFGVAQIKRLDNMYFGYTSEGQLAVQVEVYDSGHTPATYLLEERPASAPRNSRVTPGKGLWGRYWRLTITNADGADFEVHDATVDLAVSSRRI